MIRGERVILDADLAELYGIETRRLNEQGKRNMELFSPGLHVPALVGRVFPLEIAFCDIKIRIGSVLQAPACLPQSRTSWPFRVSEEEAYRFHAKEGH